MTWVMGSFIKDNGFQEVDVMGKVFKYGLMGKNMRACGSMIKDKVKGDVYFPTVMCMKVIGLMI